MWRAPVRESNILIVSRAMQRTPMAMSVNREPRFIKPEVGLSRTSALSFTTPTFHMTRTATYAAAFWCSIDAWG